MPIQKKTDVQTLTVLFLSFFLLLGLGTVVVVSNNSRSTDSRSQASFDGPFVTLSPEKFESENSGDLMVVSLHLNTESQAVGGVSGAVLYDSSILELKSHHPGSFFQELEIDTPNGSVELFSKEVVAGEGEIISLVFKVIAGSFEDTTVQLSDTFTIYDTSGNLNTLTALPNPILVQDE